MTANMTTAAIVFKINKLLTAIRTTTIPENIKSYFELVFILADELDQRGVDLVQYKSQDDHGHTIYKM